MNERKGTHALTHTQKKERIYEMALYNQKYKKRTEKPALMANRLTFSFFSFFCLCSFNHSQSPSLSRTLALSKVYKNIQAIFHWHEMTELE